MPGITGMGMYAWYYRYNSCEVNAVKETSALLVTQLKMYDHTFQFATSASRTSLVRPVTALKLILMDTQDVVVPACMQSAKNELINYMGTVIRAFQAYGAGESDATILGLIKQSDVQYKNFNAELEAVNKCAPFCAPWD